MTKPISRRTLRRMATRDRQKIVKVMKSDLAYLIKPRPKYLPMFFWVWLLSKCINRNDKQIVKICRQQNKLQPTQ